MKIVKGLLTLALVGVASFAATTGVSAVEELDTSGAGADTIVIEESGSVDADTDNAETLDTDDSETLGTDIDALDVGEDSSSSNSVSAVNSSSVSVPKTGKLSTAIPIVCACVVTIGLLYYVFKKKD